MSCAVPPAGASASSRPRPKKNAAFQQTKPKGSLTGSIERRIAARTTTVIYTVGRLSQVQFAMKIRFSSQAQTFYVSGLKHPGVR